MLKRKAADRLEAWPANDEKKALLASETRQVGKTYLIDAFAAEHFENVAKFDLVDPDAKARAVGKIEDAFDDAMSVFERTAAERRKELEQQSGAAEKSDASRTAKMSANAILFSIEELEEMLAVLRRAS